MGKFEEFDDIPDAEIMPVQPAEPQTGPREEPTALKTMAQQLLDELRGLAFSDVAEMYDENNCLRPIGDMTPGIRRAIAEITTQEIIHPGTREIMGHTKKVKLWDKKSSIDSFMRHLGMFVDKLETKTSVKISSVDVDGKTPEQLIAMLNGKEL